MNRFKKRSRWTWIVTMVALALVMAACSTDSDTTDTSGEVVAEDSDTTDTSGEVVAEDSDTTDTSGEVVAEDSDSGTGEETETGGERILTIGVPGDVETLDPCCANFIRSHEALLMVYEVPVIHPTEVQDGALVGTATKLDGLYFESWEAHEDGLTYTIKVRQGVTFVDGTPVTAETVRFMVERNLNTPGGGAWLLTNIAFVTEPPTVIDEYTLELKSDKPSPMVMQSFYMSSSAAIDPRVVADNATDDDPWAMEFMTRQALNGSGPYVITSRVADQEIVFEARADYWGGAPAYDKIIWKIIPSAAARVQLLKSGDIDVAIGLGTVDFEALAGVDGINVVSAPSKNMVYVGMNNSIAPFDDKAVRQAVSYGIDYNDLLENVYQGDARRLWGPLPYGGAASLGDAIGYSRDVAKGIDLLGASTFDGGTVTLSIDSARSEHQLIAVRVQAALREIGMDVEIEQLPSAVFAERKVAKELQMFIDEMLAWIDDPNYSLSLTLEGGVFGNYTDYSNDRVNQIITDGWGELDPTARQAMFEEAQRLIVDDAPWAFLAQPDYKIAMRDTIGGFVLYPNEIPRFANFEPAG